MGFEEVIGDLVRVIGRINAHFETKFAEFKHEEDAVAALMSSARRHVGPNSDRDMIEGQLAWAYEANKLVSLRKRAEAVYYQVIACRDVQIMRVT